MTRARWLSLWLLLFAGLAPAQEDLRPVTILHTNDLHARFLPDGRQRGGFAQLATVIRREREGCRGCLLLNAGDLVQGSPVSTLFRGLPVYEVANMLGFDASTIGNHEFDYGWAKVKEFIHVARFPVVSANVVDDHGRLLAPNAWIIRSASGVRVAIIGVLTADLPQLSTPDLLGPYRALAVADTARQYANEVRGRSDLIVLLAHISPEEEDQVLQQDPEIPVVISGHAHRALEQPKRADGRLVVRVSPYGEELGRLDLMVDRQKKSVASSTWKRIPVDAKTIPPAPDVAKAVAAWEAKVSKLVDVPIGEAKREFARKGLKELMERAMAEETGADFAFMNPGGIRDFIPKGTILARHVWNVMPFDNHVVVGTFKGSQLPSVVTTGRQIEPSREYKLAVPDFVASNQKPEMGTTDLQFPIIGPLQRDLLIDWIKKKKVLE